MKKKVIILCMSCNQSRFVNEEYIIRKTWGGDILDGKYDNIELLFYRGGSDNTYLENDVLHLTSDDTLLGTYQKSIDCFKWLVENKQFDYIVRTNTSTYINVDAIQQFLEFNVNEETVCGSYLIMNGANKFIPFLPGFFLIFSKKIIELLVNDRLQINSFDDNSFATSLFNRFKQNYLTERHILEVDSISDIKKTYFNKLSTAYCVRVKDESNSENNIINMIGIHVLFKNIKTQVNPPHGFTKISTLYGEIPID